MFCPWCGRELERQGEALSCVVGDMPLSKVMERRLTQLVGEEAATNIAPLRAYPALSAWYCPRCRHQLVSEHCPQCGLELTTQDVHQLVEIHPHRQIEPARVILHLNGGYTRVRLERYEGHGLADGGFEWDISTEIIPPHLRFTGTRFLLIRGISNSPYDLEIQELESSVGIKEKKPLRDSQEQK